ncbi:MAG: hypothetical protein LBQ51_01700 [Desulfovibrio sp.]|jgi:hypothetical protein|nr:hypothetical protein [Desulfovibrio sp.]
MEGEGSHNYVIFDDSAIQTLKTYYQTELDGRDPQYAEQQAKFDALQPISVSSNTVLNLREGDKFMQRAVDWIQGKGLFGLYTNVDKRIDNIIFDESSVERVISHGARDGKIALLEVVPEMIKNGVFLETTDADTPLKRHIFASRAIVDGMPYAIGFVVREDVNGRRYYDHSLTEMTALDKPWKESQTPSITARANPVNRESVSDIVRKHLGVNPDFTLNSPGPGGKLRGQDKGNLGYTRFAPGSYRIVLGKNANLSTLLYFFVGHERSRNESDPTIWATERFVGIFVSIKKNVYQLTA